MNMWDDRRRLPDICSMMLSNRGLLIDGLDDHALVGLMDESILVVYQIKWVSYSHLYSLAR